MLLAEENSVLLRGGDGDGRLASRHAMYVSEKEEVGEGFQEGRDIGCSLRLLKVSEQPAPAKGLVFDSICISGSLYAAHPRYPR